MCLITSKGYFHCHLDPISVEINVKIRWIIFTLFLISDSNKCDSENNNNIENISSDKNILVPRIIDDHKNTVSIEEYEVNLEKMWGTIGMQIEVCIDI